MSSYRTPLSRVRGLGSAKSGTEHFWSQRLTGVANLLLLVFVFYTALSLAGAPYPAVIAYFSSPFTAALAALFAISVSYHMRLGMQIIIEDYVHTETTKLILLMLNTFFSVLVGLTCVIAIIKLSLGA